VLLSVEKLEKGGSHDLLGKQVSQLSHLHLYICRLNW